MNILAILVVGVLAGLIAGFMRGGWGFGILGDLVVGLVGAFVGGFFFGNSLSITSIMFINVLITSTVGAIIFLFVIGLFYRPYSRRGQV